MAIAIAIKLLIFVLLITISSVIGIQVFENVSENSTKIIPTTTNHNNNNNDSNNSSTDSSNNNNDLNNRNISESGSINEQTTGTMSSSRYNNHKSHQRQRNHHRETTKNTFLTNIHNTMPIQYPKTTNDEDHENDSDERDNDPVEHGQNVNSKYHQTSHNKKRQLFGKTTPKSTDRLNSTKSDASNHNLTPSNSHHSTLNFVPSPQFDEFNEQPSYSSPNHQNQVQFKPAPYDSYQNIPISHTESPRFVDFPKYPSVMDLNKEYPKFDELSKHYQQTQHQEARHNGRNFFYNQHHYNHHTVTTQPPPPPPPTITEIPVEYQTIHQTNGFSDDGGQFIWIPNTAAPSPTSEQSPISHETKNGTGKWKWVSDDDNSGVEPKIMTPINPHPSYYEQIKIYHDIKTHPILQSDFPYSFDFKGGNGWDSSSIPGGNGKGAENGIGENVTSLLAQWESMGSGKDEKEQNKTESETPSFGKGNFGLADILFPLMHKGKPAESANKHIGNSSWKKVLHFLTAAIPIGLIISSLAPQVIYINANDTGLPPRPSFLPSVFKPAFQRSLDGNDELRDESRKMTNPLMDFLQILGENTRHGSVEQNTICEDRVFCEIAVLGAGKNADVLNKMLWKIANETPEPQARRSGLSEIFRVIRENRCNIYECERIRNSFKMSN